VAALALGLWGAWAALTRPPIVAPPTLDLSGCSPALAELVSQVQSSLAASPQDAELWGRLGMVLFANQFDPEPLACFAQAERLAPRDFRWPYLYGLAIASTNREAAVEAFQRALQRRDDQGVVHNRLGELLLELGRFDQAATHLQAAQRLQPTAPRPLAALARLELARGNLPQARRWAERAVRADPQQRALHELLATIQQRAGDATAAVATLQLAEGLPDEPLGWHDPVAGPALEFRRDPGWQLEQAEMLLSEGRHPEAVRLLQQSLRDDDRNPQSYCVLARAWLQMGEQKRAAEVLEQAAARHPNSPEVRFQGGVLSFLAKDYQEAARLFRAAIEAKPDYGLAHYNLGHALEQLGQVEAALAAFELAARYRPTHTGAHTNAGRILLDQGHVEAAREHLEVSVRFAPGDREARQLLQQLRDMSPGDHPSK